MLRRPSRKKSWMLACQHSLASAQQSAQRWRRKASDLVEDLEFDELELQLVRSFSRRGVGTRPAPGAESLQSESCRGGSAAARPASSGRPVVVLQRADREGSAAHHLDPVRRRRGGERGEVRHPAFERRAAMQRAAIFASGTPIALLTNGTVRLARGFTSRTNTRFALTANCTFMRPTTPSSRASATVYRRISAWASASSE